MGKNNVEGYKTSRTEKPSFSPKNMADAEKTVVKPRVKMRKEKRIARRESIVFTGQEVEKVSALRQRDQITNPTYHDKVNTISLVSEAFGFSGEEKVIILRQLNRESWNPWKKISYDERVVAGGDNTGITQIRPATAREAAQRLCIADLRVLKRERGMIDTNRLNRKGGAVVHEAEDAQVIWYLQSHWASNIVLGLSYLAFLRKRLDTYPGFSSIQPAREKMRYVLAAYNCGETRFFRLLSRRSKNGGIAWRNVDPFLNHTTAEYVRIVMEDPVYKRRSS